MRAAHEHHRQHHHPQSQQPRQDHAGAPTFTSRPEVQPSQPTNADQGIPRSSPVTNCLLPLYKVYKDTKIQKYMPAVTRRTRQLCVREAPPRCARVKPAPRRPAYHRLPPARMWSRGAPPGVTCLIASAFPCSVAPYAPFRTVAAGRIR